MLDRRNGELVVPAPENQYRRALPKVITLQNPALLRSELPSEERSDRRGHVGATMFDQLVCRVIFHQLRYEGIFTRRLSRARWCSRVTGDV